MDISFLLNNPWWESNKDHVLQMTDAIIFLCLFICVLYLFVFGLMSLINSKRKYETALKKHKFIVLYLARSNNDELLISSIIEFIAQDYPTKEYNILVGYNDLQQNTLCLLKDLGVGSLRLATNLDDTTVCVKTVIRELKNRNYDMILLFNEVDTVAPHFLSRINDAFYSGCMAIQTHRVPLVLEGLGGRMSFFSGEINNSIFRKGHVNLGFSAALNSSGIAIDFQWMKENVEKLGHNDIIKQLETSLLRQNIYIEYLSDVYTFVGKPHVKSSFSNIFQKRHFNWMRDTNKNVLRELPRLATYLFRGNWDYCDKIFQWFIPSRINLTIMIFGITTAVFVYNWGMAVKWGILLIMLLISYSISAPERIIDKKHYKKNMEK